MSSELTYKRSGVDIEEGNRFISLITPMVKRTFRPEVMTDIGSFSALFKLDMTRYREPVLVSGTDGVGTKLKIAFMMDRHSTIGIDLVAMCVNDILTSGAEPLFFLDYFATGKLKTGKATEVISGIVNGCEEAGCSLIGGETAEMPGFYSENEYDLSGFAVGVVDKEKIIDGANIREGDVIIGLASSGLHSNGYSLVRKIFFELNKFNVDSDVPELGITLGEELLKPTRIYVQAFMALRENLEIKGMAHVTGGGIPGNLPRILPEGVSANIKIGSWPVPPIFNLIEKMGNIPDKEMKKTFNMGIGYIIVVSEGISESAISLLNNTGYRAFVIGGIEKGGRDVRYS
ncbi:MAG: phosphoribosylformylglycinamidine cyclo-ligase [Nitrospirota bacterium]|nr:phosphoribosylformylglycinamidine cyclo-ligase [Nitrospirota bacterium]MDH5768467.1 phosphoribosylformylglycinamidine cyclo-ligase [Nitrospirota bacterium]